MDAIEFVRESKKVHGEIYDYGSVVYVNAVTDVVLVCDKHGKFNVQPHAHLLRGYGCQECGKITRREKIVARNKSGTKTAEDFVLRAQDMYPGVYSYSMVEYIGCHKKVKIECPHHGVYEQTPSHHLSASGGCVKCKHSNRIMSHLEIAKIKFNNKYVYSNVDADSGMVEVTCMEHGIFKIDAYTHMTRKFGGCTGCAANARGATMSARNASTPEDFLARCAKVHDDKYSYFGTTYRGSKSAMEIRCPAHGKFVQKAGDHMSGSGCQKCANIARSKKEEHWLNIHGLTDEMKHRRLCVGGKIIIADGFDPLTNTVYEFWGDYWHGNPAVYEHHEVNQRCKKTFGELYANTIEKIRLIEGDGYKLVQIWERDYDETYGR